MYKKYLFGFGLFVFFSFVFVAVFASFIVTHDPWEMGEPLQRPGNGHLLGTNDIGQDIFSELIFGSRVSLFVGLTAALIVTLSGTMLALIAGFFRGFIDDIIMRLTDFALVIPSLPLAIVLVLYLDPGIMSIIIAISVTGWATTARIVRSRVLQVREMPFIQSSRALGAKPFYIIFKHIIPNIDEVVLIRFTLSVSGAMLSEAGLSFLGLGSPLYKSWGMILRYAFFRGGIINGYWWWYVPPIICISLCIFSIVLISFSQSESRGRESYWGVDRM